MIIKIGFSVHKSNGNLESHSESRYLGRSPFTNSYCTMILRLRSSSMPMLILMLACSPEALPHPSLAKVSNHSFSRPAEAIVRHGEFDLNVNFSKHTISGKASLFFQNETKTDTLVLDTRGLVIKRVTLGPKNQRTHFRIGEAVQYVGQPLIVKIEPDTKLVNIWYETTPDAEALQWLDPEQTADGKTPFLYTQSEPILARTWIPCQDNPSVKITYRARVRVPHGMLALMTAQNPVKKSPTGVYEFFMPQPIPSYLIALAVGNLEFRSINTHCGVYAEPSVVDTAAWEFADLDSMMSVAESICGPYRWQRYDVLVLPPSFPMGGMENARLTFATPTLLAGDRSLVSVIAHELAHSWSGNLVTNATWNDLWLNEGMATYLERRIVESLYGRDQSEMQAVLAMQDLKRDLDTKGLTNPDTRLKPDYTGRNLDDMDDVVPYEKGYLFLRCLEEASGRERFDDFLRSYFDTYAFQSITTEDFLSYLNEQLNRGDTSITSVVSIDQWVYNPGLPKVIPVITSADFEKVDSVARSFSQGKGIQSPTGWSTQEIQHFLRLVPKPLSQSQITTLENTFKFSRSRNSEILDEWFLHVIASNYEAAYPQLESFLVRIGRAKYLKPLYGELAGTSEGLTLAKKIYARARKGYHSITRGMLDAIVGWKE
jgi:leukotriene-A4 hydrolase